MSKRKGPLPMVVDKEGALGDTPPEAPEAKGNIPNASVQIACGLEETSGKPVLVVIHPELGRIPLVLTVQGFLTLTLRMNEVALGMFQNLAKMFGG